MDSQFYLHLADIRLRQTWGLLHHMIADYEDQEALHNAMHAIGTARDILAGLNSR